MNTNIDSNIGNRRNYNAKNMALTHLESNLICDICDKKFLCKSTLLRHRNKEHKNHLSCNQCTKKCNSYKMLEKHKLKHTRDDRITCIHCGGVYTLNYINMHIASCRYKKKSINKTIINQNNNKNNNKNDILSESLSNNSNGTLENTIKKRSFEDDEINVKIEVTENGCKKRTIVIDDLIICQIMK